MGPVEAVRSVLSQYANFSGRARRSEYWWFHVFTVVVVLLLGGLDLALGADGLVYMVGGVGLTLGLMVPALAVIVRRLHDTGRSGWWYLVAFIPFIGAIVVLIALATDGQPGDNQYGPSPKSPATRYA